MAEQNANAVAITGGTVSDTTLTSDTVSNNLQFTPTAAPTYSEGDVWYDSTEKALAFYNDSSTIAVHVSQDLIFKVINNTGTTIPNGSPVYITSTSSGQTYPNVALARADVAATASVIGLTNGAIANGAIGYVSSQGTIDNVNTGTFTVGQVLYLNPYSAGQLMNTVPPTGITVQVGIATFINSSTGKIYVKQTTPLAVPASIITGTLGVPNGGTGATTLTGYVKGSGTSAMTASSTIPNTDISGLGTISTQNANSVAVTGGTIDNTVVGATTPAAGTFTTLTSSGTATLANGSTTYVQVKGDAAYPGVYAAGGTNTPLVLQPLGTGALQAQATTSTATGGNARGANAVDWQTARATAAQVASGSNSFIGAGSNNIVTTFAGSVVGGLSNSAGGSNFGFVGGGQSNIAGAGVSQSTAIVGGQSNSALGWYNFIGGGFTNSGTASTAATTNTTTIAVTASTTLYLSSANANIKVGQLTRATGVADSTYATSTVTTGTPAVMNTSTISGTTLTVGSLASGTIIAGQVLTGTGVTAGTYIVSGSGLSWTVSTSQTVTSTTIIGTAYTFTISQAATTAAGVTLSFYTPHGVVVGGGNNQATGAYSFIGGGGDAGTAANRNTASGDWSTVAGGSLNTASGVGSFIGGGGAGVFSGVSGSGNTASGAASTIAGGALNNASAIGSSILGGVSNSANGAYSTVLGYQGSARSIAQAFIFSTTRNSTSGDSQAGLYIQRTQTTDATATVLVTNGAAVSGTNQITLPNNSAYYFTGEVIAGVTGGGNTKGWTIEGVIKRGAGVGTTALVGSPTVTSSYADAGAATWAVAVTANTTLGCLTITVTGQASTTIRWVAQIRTTEMTY
jgi:hypothetical protein